MTAAPAVASLGTNFLVKRPSKQHILRLISFWSTLIRPLDVQESV